LKKQQDRKTQGNQEITDTEWDDLMDHLEQEAEGYDDPRSYDNLSQHQCLSCGVRMSVSEYEQCEDTCDECLHTQLAGLDSFDDYEDLELDETEYNDNDE